MADWRQWFAMAQQSYNAAVVLSNDKDFVRSAASRYYYAGYQAMTALLLYSGQTPPIVDGVERESWNHDVTPQMLLDNLNLILRERNSRYQIRSKLQELYKVRIYADYAGSQPIAPERLKAVRKESHYLLKVAKDALPTE
jgi:uncharacterized protein (UPF0332 family)